MKTQRSQLQNEAAAKLLVQNRHRQTVDADRANANAFVIFGVYGVLEQLGQSRTADGGESSRVATDNTDR